MSLREEVLSFPCRGETLFGVLSLPEAEAEAETAVLVVVGGPQTRVGSHRQFVLLARALANAGFACLRFDYRGMGDSTGALRGFDAIDEDIAAALAALDVRLPRLRRRFLWGLCDGATAAVFHAADNASVDGLILLNPWVRTGQGEARALIANYYRGRFFSWAFWSKLLCGGLDLEARAKEFLVNLKSSRQASTPAAVDLPTRFAQALRRAGKPVLLILSGRDLTAAEFNEAALREPLASALACVALNRCEIREANHTFSSELWRAEVEALTIDWLEGRWADPGKG